MTREKCGAGFEQRQPKLAASANLFVSCCDTDMAAAEYDIFLSHAWADGDRPQQIADALTKAGLRVWFDAAEINDFAGITHAVTEGLAKSKALLAYYSKTYPLR